MCSGEIRNFFDELMAIRRRSRALSFSRVVGVKGTGSNGSLLNLLRRSAVTFSSPLMYSHHGSIRA